MSKFLLIILIALCVLFIYVLSNKNVFSGNTPVAHWLEKKFGEEKDNFLNSFHINIYIDVDDLNDKLPTLLNDKDKILVSSVLYKSFIRSKTNYLDKSRFLTFNKKEEQDIFGVLKQNTQWLILPSDFNVDTIYQLFDNYHGKNLFTEYYELKFEGKNANVYKRKKNENRAVLIYRNKFILDDSEYIVKGINSYNLAYQKLPDIKKTFFDLNQAGVNTIRFWAFEKNISDLKSEKEKSKAIQDHWKRLDLVLSLADKYNIKVIPVLVNNWDDFGGKKYYLQQSYLDTKNKDLFFSEKKPKILFKKYIKEIIYRKNNLTGLYYKDDDNILAWEIMNEPRISVNKRKILHNWVDEIARYIKQSDNKHLVYIGSELETGLSRDTQKPMNLCTIESIDICSLHLYLYNGKKLVYDNLDKILDLFLKHKEFANQHNKPIILGEFGISEKNKPYGQSPVETLKFISQQATKTKLNGYLIWDWDPLYYYDPLSFSNNKNKLYNKNVLKNILRNNNLE